MHYCGEVREVAATLLTLLLQSPCLSSADVDIAKSEITKNTILTEIFCELVNLYVFIALKYLPVQDMREGAYRLRQKICMNRKWWI